MIITDEITTTISHYNIDYYKSIGYLDIKCNQKIKIKVLELPKESNLKIIVSCDFCNNEKEISYQKYNKNIKSNNLYSCSNKCAVSKIKNTNLERYGDENYVNTKLQSKNVKEKYDLITDEIIKCGFIKCSKCSIEFNISLFIKNKNGRYKKVCKNCRTIQNSNNRRIRVYKNPELESIKSKNYRKRIIHIIAWRGLLRGYLERKNIKKTDKTLNLLKYEPNILKIHLELLFEKDMNWENYGSYWQIDHIIPVSLFKDDTEAHIVNELKNLRPLYTNINNSRKNKLDEVGTILINEYKTYIKSEYIIKYKIK